MIKQLASILVVETHPHADHLLRAVLQYNASCMQNQFRNDMWKLTIYDKISQNETVLKSPIFPNEKSVSLQNHKAEMST